MKSKRQVSHGLLRTPVWAALSLWPARRSANCTFLPAGQDFHRCNWPAESVAPGASSCDTLPCWHHLKAPSPVNQWQHCGKSCTTPRMPSELAGRPAQVELRLNCASPCTATQGRSHCPCHAAAGTGCQPQIELCVVSMSMCAMSRPPLTLLCQDAEQVLAA